MPSERPYRSQGVFEHCSNGFITGWAIDARNPNAPLRVDLFIDDVAITTVTADQYRDDLRDAGLGDGRHGFEIAVPHHLQDGVPHRLRLRVAGATTDLRNTPVSTILGDRLPAIPNHQPARRSTPRDPPPSLALIIPTHNRGAILERTIRAHARSPLWLTIELIVVDDGSTDNTAARLAQLAVEFSNITFITTPNGGPARARNRAASLATAPILLFLGDDTEPVDDNLIHTHLNAHARFPAKTVAVLGKITWPARDDFLVNLVMRHIQGDGQQQFGYKFLTPYTLYDWRYFWSSNISLKRDIITDWLHDGFDERFALAAFEDTEFAYRLAQQSGLEILYVPAAALAHNHPHTVPTFIARQTAAGRMARLFLERHPGLAHEIGIQEIDRQLDRPLSTQVFDIQHYHNVLAALKSWALIAEDTGLGSHPWHTELLTAVFQLAFFEGYLLAEARPDANIPAAARWILNRALADLNPALSRDVMGQAVQLLLA